MSEPEEPTKSTPPAKPAAKRTAARKRTTAAKPSAAEPTAREPRAPAPVQGATPPPPDGPAPKVVPHPSVQERRTTGKEARTRAPLSTHKTWEAASDRADPVALLEEQDRTREADLVPVRHGRMLVSPFTFYRGAAKIMAADLAETPTAGLLVQLCGDAHLSNFGMFASPERRLLFDLNDFDETLPGPFEYDVKRMAASFTIAARNNAFPKADQRDVTLIAARTYREAMASFAGMSTLDVWYAHLSEDDLRNVIGQAAKKARKEGMSKKVVEKAEARSAATFAKAHTRDSLQALSKLAEMVDGEYRIVSQPPVVIPLRDVAALSGLSAEQVDAVIHDQFRAYRSTLQHDRRKLLERYRIVDAARKVVGVGSVGTRAFIALLEGRDEQDPLFLQVKEATASVLEDHLPKSRFKNPGERVVQGQRMMQAVSDIFLGWTKGLEQGRFYYWRQLRDMKGSFEAEWMDTKALGLYAGVCAWTLARAHARSGDAVAIAAYLGSSDKFDRAIASFSERYADQNERDFEAFGAAVRSGRIEAVEGV
ncbi:MAG TPA: DUF2252 family protein [Actinomycetota bacterium]|nr:DUF2252 family protein [Actinomycetota bacterium]